MQRMAEQLLGSKADAKDVVQDLFVELWQQRRRLDQVENLQGYCVRMTQFRCVDRLKTQKLTMVPLDERVVQVPNSETDGDEEEQRYALLQQRMATLSAEEQHFIKLRYWESCSSSEIGRQFGMSEASVRVRLHRIIQKLRKDGKQDSASAIKNKKMKQTLKLLILVLLLAGAMLTQAQTTPRVWDNAPQVDTTLNMLRIGGSLQAGFGGGLFSESSALHLEYDRKINRLFQAGVYMGLFQSWHSELDTSIYGYYVSVSGGDTLYIGSGTEYVPTLSVRGGVVGTLNLMPLIKPNSKWGFYANARVGLVHYAFDHVDRVRYDHSNLTERIPVKPNRMECSLGLGVSYSFASHWGLYAEVDFTQKYFEDLGLRGAAMVPNTHFGLTYRF